MSAQSHPELSRTIIDLGHQLLSFHRVKHIRKPEFTALAEPFRTKYPFPDPAPTYPPDWLSDDQTLKSAISRFVSAAEPILRIQDRPQRPAAPAGSITRDTTTTSFDYEIDRNPDEMAHNQLTRDDVQDIINNSIDRIVRTTLANIRNEGGLTDPQDSPGPQRERGPSSTAVTASTRFSPKEIGFFSPRLDEREGKGDIVQIGPDTYIRNVYHFIERIKDAVALRGEAEVKANITQCFRGAAMEWYTDTLTKLEKEALRTGSIALWYDLLEDKWKELTTVAVKQVLSARYTLEDAVAGKDIATHIHYVMRHAKPANMSDHYAQLSIIYASINPILRGYIPAPTPETTVDNFTRACEAQREVWQEIARLYLARQTRPATPQSFRQTPRSAGGQYSTRRYNTAQPPYPQDTFNPGYRSHPYPSTSGYGQSTGYRGAYPTTNYNRQPAPSLPPARQPLQITDGTPPSRSPTGSRPYAPNRPAHQGQQGTQPGLRPFQSRAFHSSADRIADSTADRWTPEYETEYDRRDYGPSEPWHDQTDEATIDESTPHDTEPQPEEDQIASTSFVHSYHTSPILLRKAVCRNCQQAFDSRNKLHRHISICKHKRPSGSKGKQKPEPNPMSKAQPALPEKLSDLPIIQAPPPADTKGHGFRTWHYATVQATLSNHTPTTPIGADSGSTPTIVGRNWLKEQGFEGTERHMDRPLHLTGLEVKPIATENYVNLDLLIPGNRISDRSPAKLALPVEAHVIPYLKAGVLIGGDTLGHFGANLDFKRRVIAIQDCDFEAPIKVLAKDHSRIKRVVTAKQQTTIPAHSVMAVPINIRERDRIPTDRDFSFLPEFKSPQLGPGGGVYAHLIDRDADFVHIQNNSDQPFEVRRKTRLGIFTDCNEEGAYSISTHQHQMATASRHWLKQDPATDQTTWQVANPLADVLSAAEQAGLSARSADIAPSMEHKIAFDITAYGSPDVVRQYDEDVRPYESVFKDKGTNVDMPAGDWLKIPLAGDWTSSDAKLAHRVYPMGLKEQQLIDETFDKMHKDNKMEWSTEPTPFGFPVFVAWRTVYTDGKPVRKGRVVVDIRGLNKITIKDAYPLPNMSDIIAAVSGCEYITVVDAQAFFHQFPVAEADRHKFTVVSHRGTERYRVAMMGFKNSPPHAQRYMDQITRDMKHFLRVYIDDFIVHSRTLQEHREHLKQLWQLCSHHKITLKPSKCFLGYPSITLLGQKVSAFGLAIPEDKLAAVTQIPFPETLKDLEHYLGLTSWLRRYIRDYAMLAEPLQRRKTNGLKAGPKSKGNQRTAFCKSDKVERSPELIDAYNKLQTAIQEARILAHFDPARQLYIGVDTSKKGIGIMAFHAIGDPTDDKEIHKQNKIQPIMFLSRTLTPAETRYWPTELEVAGVVWAISKLRHLINSSSRPTIVYTDHSAAVWIARQTSLMTTSTEKLNLRLVRASAFLSQFDLDVRFRPGKEHVIADALSRLPQHDGMAEGLDEFLDNQVAFSDVCEPVYTYNATLAEMSTDFRKAIQIGYQKDRRWTRLSHLVGEDVAPGVRFVRRDGLIYHVDSLDGRLRLCIPKDIEHEIFALAHDEQNHCGYHRAYERIRATYFVRRLARRLRQYLTHCRLCNLNQTKRHPPYGELRPIQPPIVPFHTVTIDFIAALPPFGGLDMALTVTCKASKQCTILSGKSTYSAADWAGVFLEGTVDWGLPSAIISDRDRKFMSQFWHDLFKRMGVQQMFTTAYHPQSDGQSERTNQTAEVALRFWLSEGNKDWPRFLPFLRGSLNNSFNASIGMSPNEYCYGHRVQEPADLINPASQLDSELDPATARLILRQEAADAQAYANIRMKERFDAKHQPLRLQPGDWAFINLHHGYKIPGQESSKFSQQRTGPFVVQEVYGKGNAYKLGLPDHWKIHPVISVEHLEPAPAPSSDPFERPIPDHPPAIDDDAHADQWRVDKLIDRRIRRVGRYRKEVTEYLVQWTGYGPEWNQWVKEDDVSDDVIEEYKRSIGEPSTEEGDEE